MDDTENAVVGIAERWSHDQPEGPAGDAVHPKDKARWSVLPGAAQRVDVDDASQAPWNGIALINMFRAGNRVLVGTGFLCASDVLLTARHNLTSTDYDSAGVWLGYDASSNPKVSTQVIRAYATHRDLDLAVLILDAPHPGVFTLRDAAAEQDQVSVAGYGLPYGDGRPRLSQASGALGKIEATTVRYQVSTREGDSGGPVFVVDRHVATAMAVHSAAPLGGLAGNVGVRLSATTIRDINILIAHARTRIGA